MNVSYYMDSTPNGLTLIHVPNVSRSQQRNCLNGGRTKPDSDKAPSELDGEEGKSRCGGNARRRAAEEATEAGRGMGLKKGLQNSHCAALVLTWLAGPLRLQMLV